MPYTFSLKNFEGPIDLLFLLVKKDEIEIIDITIHLLTTQLLAYLENNDKFDEQSDQIAVIAHLLALKSRKILPSIEKEEQDLSIEQETKSELIAQLLEQCQFKDIAELLQEKELQSYSHFTRMLPSLATEKTFSSTLGLEDVTLIQLKNLFENVYREAKNSNATTIIGHKWEVKTQMEMLLLLLTQQKELLFGMLFKKTSCKEELIVTFLALLELIKQEKLLVRLKDNEFKFIRN